MDISGFKKTERPIRETSIEKKLVRDVEKLGGLCLKWICPGTSGVPDRIVIYKGLVEFVELKRPGGKLRPLQKTVHEKLAKQHACVVTISTERQVEGYLAGLRIRAKVREERRKSEPLPEAAG